MDDRRINSLIRMAAEVEELERSAREPSLRLVHAAGSPAGRPARGRRSLALRLSPLVAAAACVGLAIYLIPSKPPAVEPTRVAVTDHHAASIVIDDPDDRPPLTMAQAAELMRRLEHPPEFASGVLSIFQDGSGVVRCVRWQPQDFGGRQIEQLTPDELVRATYGSHCNVIGPHKVIAVAVAGLRENLPDSDERAQDLAQCIVGEEAVRRCGIEPLAFSSSAAKCVPTGLHVSQAAVMGMGRN